jgi:hypothetical protein
VAREHSRWPSQVSQKRRDLGHPAFLQGEQSCTESRALTCHRKIGGEALSSRALRPVASRRNHPFGEKENKVDR